jgi:hypothetical protein
MKRAILTVALILSPTLLLAAPPRLANPSGPLIPTVVVPVGNGNFVVNTGKGLPTLVQVAPFIPTPTCIPAPSRSFNLAPAPLPYTGGGYGGGYFPNTGIGAETIINPYVRQK